MKTIFRILVILLVAALVAGGFALAVNNTSTTAGFGGEGRQIPAMSGANGQSMQQMPGRPEGDFGSDRDGGASVGGFFGIFGTLAKLAGITAIVLLIEKGISLLMNKKALGTA